MSKINTHPDHLRRSGSKLSGFGGKLADGGQKLETAGQDLVSHASNDRSGIGAVVAKAMGKGVQITGKVFSEGGRVVEGAGKRLHTTADLHEEADTKAASLLKKHHPDVKGDVDPKGGGPRGATKVGSPGGRRGRSARAHVGGKARDHAVPDSGRTKTKDPVDLATGEVLLTQTDLDLPGVLPLVLSRTHLSSYRIGRSFGASWASTVDQRLEVDGQGVVFVAADGVLLVYPTPPEDGTAVWAEEGPRWPLCRVTDGYQIEQPESGHSLRFVGSGVLSAISDRAGHSIDITRGADGAPAAITHSGGYQVSVDTTDGLITVLRVGDVPVKRFCYDDQRRLVEVINTSGQPLRFAYDSEGRLIEWVDRNEIWYRYHYDTAGRCTFAEGMDGQLNCTIEYDLDNLVTTATDSLGHATHYHLNEAKQVVAIVDPLGGRTTSEWDRYDRLLSRTDPLGRTTRFDYSETGDLLRVTRPDGSQAVAEYNDLHQPITVVDPDDAVWRREYDAVGNLVALTDPAGAVTRYSYDEQNHLANTTDPLGAVTHIASDTAGLPIAVTDPLGAVTRYERDPFGRVTTITDPLGGTTRLQWTLDGRLAARTQSDGTSERWTYDGEGNLIEHLDPMGRIKRTEYGGFDRLVAEIDQTGARTAYTYDSELRLTSVTNPAGLVWTYDYDSVGNLVGETDFNGRTLTYSRDLAGQLTTVVNGLGQTTTRVFDALGRMIEQRSADGAATFSYDPAGRMLHATTADADIVFTRDALGRIVAETCNGRTLTTTYDLVGRKTSRTTPTGARSQWRYDQAGNPVALDTAGHTLAFGYDPAGREITRTAGATTLTQTWDGNHRLRSQALTTPGAVNPTLTQRRSYTYRADGAVTAIVDQLAGARQFELDPLGRATAVTTAERREQYGYDASGNLTGPTRSHVGTLLRAADNARYDHDAQGRVIARHSRTLSGQARTWRYEWNTEDQLVAVTTPDQITWHYLYDALGRRIAKQRLAGDGQIVDQTWFTWDGTVLAEQTHISGHSTSWDYQPGSHTPLTQTEHTSDEVDRRFYAIITDLVGTPSELVDPAGTLAWRQATTHWGLQLGAQPQAAYCPLRFPGQYHDAETGLNYNYFRFYDPDDGVYTSPDPLGLAGGPNPHAYVPNPVRWIDPLGLTPYTPSPGKGARFIGSSSGEITDTVGNHNSVSLGRYPAYLQLAQATGSRTFNIGDAWGDMAGRTDKFGGDGPHSEIWIRNKQFLDKEIARGSDMLLASDPRDPANAKAFFGREIAYLQSKGYSVSPDGTRMIPPGGR